MSYYNRKNSPEYYAMRRDHIDTTMEHEFPDEDVNVREMFGTLWNGKPFTVPPEWLAECYEPPESTKMFYCRPKITSRLNMPIPRPPTRQPTPISTVQKVTVACGCIMIWCDEDLVEHLHCRKCRPN